MSEAEALWLEEQMAYMQLQSEVMQAAQQQAAQQQAALQQAAPLVQAHLDAPQPVAAIGASDQRTESGTLQKGRPTHACPPSFIETSFTSRVEYESWIQAGSDSAQLPGA